MDFLANPIFIYFIGWNSSNLGHLVEIEVLWAGFKDSRVNCILKHPNMQWRLEITVLDNWERIQKKWERKKCLELNECFLETIR